VTIVTATSGMSEAVVWCFCGPIPKQLVQKERWAMFSAMMMEGWMLLLLLLMMMMAIRMTRPCITIGYW
jgi:hypothetical protein